MPPIELIARAVIIKDEKILLAKRKGESNTFLPGGHIEQGEYAEEALRREIREEIGVESSIGAFIGVLEHKFTDQKGRSFEEINFIFEASLEKNDVNSNEGHLEFKWVNPREFKEKNLLPSNLQYLITEWMESKTPFHKSQKE